MISRCVSVLSAIFLLTEHEQVQIFLAADLVIEFVQVDAGVNREIFARFSQGFSRFVVPNNSRGCDIIPFGVLDVSATEGDCEIRFLSVPTECL